MKGSTALRQRNSLAPTPSGRVATAASEAHLPPSKNKSDRTHPTNAICADEGHRAAEAAAAKSLQEFIRARAESRARKEEEQRRQQQEAARAALDRRTQALRALEDFTRNQMNASAAHRRRSSSCSSASTQTNPPSSSAAPRKSIAEPSPRVAPKRRSTVANLMAPGVARQDEKENRGPSALRAGSVKKQKEQGKIASSDKEKKRKSSHKTKQHADSAVSSEQSLASESKNDGRPSGANEQATYKPVEAQRRSHRRSLAPDDLVAQRKSTVQSALSGGRRRRSMLPAVSSALADTLADESNKAVTDNSLVSAPVSETEVSVESVQSTAALQSGASTSSGGKKRRVSIACARFAQPTVAAKMRVAASVVARSKEGDAHQKSVNDAEQRLERRRKEREERELTRMRMKMAASIERERSASSSSTRVSSLRKDRKEPNRRISLATSDNKQSRSGGTPVATTAQPTQKKESRKKRNYDSILPKDLSSFSFSLEQETLEKSREHRNSGVGTSKKVNDSKSEAEEISELMMSRYEEDEDTHSEDEEQHAVAPQADAQEGVDIREADYNERGQSPLYIPEWKLRVYDALAQNMLDSIGCEELLWDAMENALALVLPSSSFNPSTLVEEMSLASLVQKKIRDWMSYGKARKGCDDVNAMLDAELESREKHGRWATIEMEEQEQLWRELPQTMRTAEAF